MDHAVPFLAGLVLHACWLGCTVGVLAAIAAAGCRGHCARRCLVWQAAMGIWLLAWVGVGVLTWPRETPAPVVISVSANPVGAVASSAAPVPSAVAPAPLLSSAPPPSTDGLTASAPWQHLLVVLWLLGISLTASGHLVGAWRLQRLRRRAVPLPQPWAELSHATLQRLGLRARVLAAEVAGPLVIGLGRPLVILPLACCQRLPPDQVEALLVHELAHLLRRDRMGLWLSLLLQTLACFHPVAWWLARRLREDREPAADARAVACGAQPRSLAAALLALAADAPPALALGAQHGQLALRVRRLLGLPTPPPRAPRFLLTPLLLLVTGVTLLVACRSTPQPLLLEERPARFAMNAPALPPIAREELIRQRWEGQAYAVQYRLAQVSPERWAAYQADCVRPGIVPRSMLTKQRDGDEHLFGFGHVGETHAALPGEATHVASIGQQAFIQDYRPSEHGLDPVIAVLLHGHCLQVRGWRDATGLLNVDASLDAYLLLGGMRTLVLQREVHLGSGATGFSTTASYPMETPRGLRLHAACAGLRFSPQEFAIVALPEPWLEDAAGLASIRTQVPAQDVVERQTLVDWRQSGYRPRSGWRAILVLWQTPEYRRQRRADSSVSVRHHTFATRAVHIADAATEESNADGAPLRLPARASIADLAQRLHRHGLPQPVFVHPGALPAGGGPTRVASEAAAEVVLAPELRSVGAVLDAIERQSLLRIELSAERFVLSPWATEPVPPALGVQTPE